MWSHLRHMGPHFPEPTLPSCGHQPTTYLTGCQASDHSLKVFPISVADLVLGSGPFHTPLWRLLGQIGAQKALEGKRGLGTVS